jgi:hypothetical protein
MAAGTSGRGPGGKFTRTIHSIRRDNKAAELRAMGWTFQRIADELGYANRQKAKDGVDRAIAEVPTEAVEQAKHLDLERIDRLIAAAWEVLERKHVTVSQGRIVGRFAGFAKDPDTGETVRNADGEPMPVYDELEDDAPVLNAIDRLEKLIARRGKILGYEAPARSRIEVITEDAVDAELRRLEQEIAERERADSGAA